MVQISSGENYSHMEGYKGGVCTLIPEILPNGKNAAYDDDLKGNY